uniref:Non-LTR retrolelement reverse transcriptase-like protein, related n=1 Tax=Medicago truncatula TaxID=3880 RepID=Q2HRP7_MEDTR|nr:non-LTR retrolelement reverse transcriptase-like protein, related [Medicago truncatula]
MEGTLREIASAVGTSLLIDNATTKRLFGHYARILVDVDFSRKLFHEILVEREGYAFTLKVAYEWLSDYFTHCQNVGHDVSACRRLYPRKDTFAPKENIAQGKKQIPVTETTWVSRKENPFGIGSSLAFGAAVTPPVADEEHTAATENSHQQQLLIGNYQQTTETEATTAALVTGITTEYEVSIAALVTGTTSNAEEDNAGSEVIPEVVQPQVVPLNCSFMNTNNTFGTTLHNLSVDVVRGNIDETPTHVLSPIKQITLDISNIVAPEGSKIDPVLQKDLDFMHTWLSKVGASEVPFIEIVSKSQKKKNVENVPYKTRSQGPLPPFK